MTAGRTLSPEALHVLDWRDAEDWEVTHPEGCPEIDRGDYTDYDCLLARIFFYEGWDPEVTTPGRYEIRAWAYQSTDPRIYGEWTSGVDVVTAPASTSSGEDPRG